MPKPLLLMTEAGANGVKCKKMPVNKWATFKDVVKQLTDEKTLDQMYFPQSFSAVRRFTQEEETELIGASNDECQTGKAATFLIRILFRQNASWQGSILWLEGKREESFRSVLELIFLMNDALNAQKSAEKK